LELHDFLAEALTLKTGMNPESTNIGRHDSKAMGLAIKPNDAGDLLFGSCT